MPNRRYKQNYNISCKKSKSAVTNFVVFPDPAATPLVWSQGQTDNFGLSNAFHVLPQYVASSQTQ
jgi:hypothetical protein